MDVEVVAGRATGFPRLLRPVEDPLALYLRPSRNDHRVLEQLLTEEPATLRGVVLSACRANAQRDLRAEACRRKVEAVLDTLMMELASPAAGARKELSAVEWASAGRRDFFCMQGAVLSARPTGHARQPAKALHDD